MERAEFKLIDWIRSRVVDRPPVKLGIGDDAAILAGSTDDCLVATDMIMEGVDFTLPPATPQLVGRKALAVNISDIAAMGGCPTAAFVSVALPKRSSVDLARELHTGILDLADRFNVVVAGGDTNSWDGPIVVNIAVLGHPCSARAITRQGAQPGDWIFVTGEFGGSLQGHHLTFTPRVAESARLVQLVNVHSMIDVSDGLAADLHHILEQSRVGAVVDAMSIPIRDAAHQAVDGRSPLEHALSDGEDFELVFTVSESDGQRLLRDWNEPTPIHVIGRITSDSQCWLTFDDGRRESLPPLGWTHAIGS